MKFVKTIARVILSVSSLSSLVVCQPACFVTTSTPDALQGIETGNPSKLEGRSVLLAGENKDEAYGLYFVSEKISRVTDYRIFRGSFDEREADLSSLETMTEGKIAETVEAPYSQEDGGIRIDTSFSDGRRVEVDLKVDPLWNFTSVTVRVNGRIVTTSFDQGFFSRPRDLVVQKDSKVLISGYYEDWLSTSHIFLVRFLDNGSLDTDFGDRGRIFENFGGRPLPQSVRIAATDDQKVIVVGSVVEDHATKSLVVARYLDDGLPDISFGENGVVRIFGTGSVSELFLSPAGDVMVAAGSSFVRVGPDGAVDTGSRIDSFPAAVQSVRSDDSRLWLAGVVDGKEYPREVVIGRYLLDGTVDPNFGSGGFVHDMIDSSLFLKKVGLDVLSDGRLILTGFYQDYEKLRQGVFALRLTDTGDRDASFGGHGLVFFETGDLLAFDADFDRFVTANGEIYLLAHEASPSSIQIQTTLLHLFPDGTVDPLFPVETLLFADVGMGDLATRIFSADASLDLAPDGSFWIMGDFENSVRIVQNRAP